VPRHTISIPPALTARRARVPKMFAIRLREGSFRLVCREANVADAALAITFEFRKNASAAIILIKLSSPVTRL
jgi:hypothetical protein